jgi:hypothetical protein
VNDTGCTNRKVAISAMTHGSRVLVEITAIMEYVDEAFLGAKLMPENAIDHWRIRWWVKFMDQLLAPSFSMFGWKFFVGFEYRVDNQCGRSTIGQSLTADRRFFRFSTFWLLVGKRRRAISCPTLLKKNRTSKRGSNALKQGHR